MSMNDDSTWADVKAVEELGEPIGFEPSTLMDQARQGGVTRANAPVTIQGGTPYDADTLNLGLRGLSDIEARQRLGLDPGD